MSWTEQDAAIDAHEALHPPRETVALACRACDDLEWEVSTDDPDRTCPRCGRDGRVL